MKHPHWWYSIPAKWNAVHFMRAINVAKWACIRSALSWPVFFRRPRQVIAGKQELVAAEQHHVTARATRRRDRNQTRRKRDRIIFLDQLLDVQSCGDVTKFSAGVIIRS